MGCKRKNIYYLQQLEIHITFLGKLSLCTVFYLFWRKINFFSSHFQSLQKHLPFKERKQEVHEWYILQIILPLMFKCSF
jgi:hypothetical protein